MMNLDKISEASNIISFYWSMKISSTISKKMFNSSKNTNVSVESLCTQLLATINLLYLSWCSPQATFMPYDK